MAKRQGMAAARLTTALAMMALCFASEARPEVPTSVRVESPARKSHTGHWAVMLRGNDSQAAMTGCLVPGVVGVMKRYTWRSLEPTSGVYNFAEVRSDLAWARSKGARLIVFIEDKTFVDEKPLPDYLAAYDVANRTGGYTAVRWAPYVVARMRALVTAFAAFDDDAYFEGLSTQETALGFDSATLDANGYTPEKYRDAYIAVLTAAANAMPKSRVFWTMNFIPRNQSYIRNIAEAASSRGVAMGGPDLLPDSASLQSQVYPFYNEFKARMPIFIHLQPDSYSHLHSPAAATKYWTMREMQLYAKKMEMDYLMWTFLPNAEAAGSYDWYDAVPIIGSTRIP